MVLKDYMSELILLEPLMNVFSLQECKEVANSQVSQKTNGDILHMANLCGCMIRPTSNGFSQQSGVSFGKRKTEEAKLIFHLLFM